MSFRGRRGFLNDEVTVSERREGTEQLTLLPPSSQITAVEVIQRAEGQRAVHSLDLHCRRVSLFLVSSGPSTSVLSLEKCLCPGGTKTDLGGMSW